MVQAQPLEPVPEPAPAPMAEPASAVAALLATAPAVALPAAAASAAEAAATLVINQRPVLRFRASLLGDGPAARAELARSAVAEALARGGAGQVTHSDTGDAVRFEVDGATVFYLVAADLGGARPGAQLAASAQQVQQRLQTAL